MGRACAWVVRSMGARCIAVADDSFPVLATLMPCPIKYKLGPRAVQGEGSWCLFCFAAQWCSTCHEHPQLARYGINTKAVMGSVSPRSVLHTSRSNINLI